MSQRNIDDDAELDRLWRKIERLEKRNAALRAQLEALVKKWRSQDEYFTGESHTPFDRAAGIAATFPKCADDLERVLGGGG